MWNIKRFAEISKALSDPKKALAHHCTFIFEKRRLLAIGTNKDKTSPKNLKYAYTGRAGQNVAHCVGIHSELDALIRLGRTDCSNLTLVNIRINKRGQVSLAKPCSGCQDLLAQTGFKNVYYSNNEGTIEKY